MNTETAQVEGTTGAKPGVAQRMAPVPKNLPRLSSIPQELSMSQKPWVPSPPYVAENYNQKASSDKKEEMALKADFTNKNPDLETIRIRAQYRPKLYFNCIPREQRYLLLCTYGPTEQGFDVESPVMGWDFFGCFETLEEVADQIAFIRQMNPHAVWLPISVLDVGTGKRIQFPPPNNGGCQNFHLNKMHGEIMKTHLKKQVEEAEYVEGRFDASIVDLKERNQIVRDYNKQLQEHAKALLGMHRDEIHQARSEARVRLYQKLEEMTQEEAVQAHPANVDGKNVVQQMNQDVKSLTYEQVDAWIDTHEKLCKLPSGYRAVYKRYISPEGEEILVRNIMVQERR